MIDYSITYQKWTLLFELMVENKCKVIVDLGISKGITELYIKDLCIINNYHIERYYGVDSFNDPLCLHGAQYFAASEAQMANLLAWPEFLFINKTTDDALVNIPNNVDMVFVDASHVPSQMIQDIKNYSEKLKDGGVLVGHEYGLFIKPIYGDYGDITRFVDSYIGKENINIIQDTRLESSFPCWLWWTYIYRNKEGKIEYFKERK